MSKSIILYVYPCTSRDFQTLAQIDEAGNFWIALKNTILIKIASIVLSIYLYFALDHQP